MEPFLNKSNSYLDIDRQATKTSFDLLDWQQALRLRKQSRSTDFLSSFTHAFSGIKETFVFERNFKIQLLCATAALSLGYLLKIDLFSWLFLIQVIALVLTAELVNTALEHLVDLTTATIFHPTAKAAKDTAAGAVLIASIFAFVSGVLIFIPRLLPFCYQVLKPFSHHS